MTCQNGDKFAPDHNDWNKFQSWSLIAVPVRLQWSKTRKRKEEHFLLLMCLRCSCLNVLGFSSEITNTAGVTPNICNKINRNHHSSSVHIIYCLTCSGKLTNAIAPESCVKLDNALPIDAIARFQSFVYF